MPKAYCGKTKVYIRCPFCKMEAPKKKLVSHCAKIHGTDVTGMAVRKDN